MLRPGQALILIVIALLLTGVIMISSAEASLGSGMIDSWREFLLSKHALMALLACAALVSGMLVPTRAFYTRRGLRSPLPWLMLLILALLLVVQLPGIGHEVNGARRWIGLGAFRFQPSEIAKWGLIPVLAGWCVWRRERLHRFWSGFLPPALLIAAVCLLIALEDLGTAVLVGLIGFAIILTAGGRFRHIVAIAPAAAAGFVAMLFHSPYRLQRLLAYVDPYQDPQGIGYHVVQSMAAVSEGGLTGRGLGGGIRKFDYLPEDTTDFIFAVVCEETGVFGAGLVLFLFAMLVLSGRSVVQRTRDPFQRLLVTGVILTISLQTLINIAVVLGVAPTKGIALPLVSHGGSGWLLTAFSIGMVVSIDRESALSKQDGQQETDLMTGANPEQLAFETRS